MRSCVTMALNVSAPFQGLSAHAGNERPPSILPPPKDVVEDEMRRNTFWVGGSQFILGLLARCKHLPKAYSIDRQTAAGNAWPMNIDDIDIHQLLPLRQDQWEQGVR